MSILKQFRIPIFAAIGAAAVFLPLSAIAGGGDIVPCDGVSTKCDFNQLLILIDNIINRFVLVIVPSITAIAFTVAGFFYITSAGNPSKVQSAHQIFTYTLIGIMIVLAAWLIVKAILTGLGLRQDIIYLK